MPAPRGAYTPRSGILAGRSFSSYYHYQNARAQALGFSSYANERTEKQAPMFQALYHRAVASGMGRTAAVSRVGQFMRQSSHRTSSGLRKHDAIKMAIDEGWVDDYDMDSDDWSPY
jgi:hypothetical protein